MTHQQRSETRVDAKFAQFYKSGNYESAAREWTENKKLRAVKQLVPHAALSFLRSGDPSAAFKLLTPIVAKKKTITVITLYAEICAASRPLHETGLAFVERNIHLLKVDQASGPMVIQLFSKIREMGGLHLLGKLLQVIEKSNISKSELSNLKGVFAREGGDWESAQMHFGNAIAFDRENHLAKYNSALIAFLNRDLVSALEYWDSRWHTSSFQRQLALTTQKTKLTPPEAISKRQSFLLMMEQGVGDELQFLPFVLRFAQELNAAFKIFCSKKTFPIINSLFANTKMTVFLHEQLPSQTEQYWLSSGDLMAFYSKSLTELMHTCTEFKVSFQDYIKSWDDCVKKSAKNKSIVGFSWYTKDTTDGLKRSISYTEFTKIFSNEHLVDFQYRDSSDHNFVEPKKASNVFHLANFDAWASPAQISLASNSCDRVVTCGNSTAHFAAITGKPTIVLVPKIPNWRWGLTERRSIWYPNVQLIRQEENDYNWIKALKSAKGKSRGDAI